MKEIWKDIKGFEKYYQVSNFGKVKSLKRKIIDNGRLVTRKEKLLIPKDIWGYDFVRLSKNGRAYNKRVHRLVAQTFIPNPHNKPTVNHKDGNKKNNRVDNLEWQTNKEQTQHAIENGLIKLRGKSKNAIPINQYDLNGVFIKKWECMTDAGEYTKTHVSKISDCCKGKRKSSNGYKWSYAYE